MRPPTLRQATAWHRAIASLVLAVALLAAPVHAQRGIANAPGDLATAHSAPLTFDAAGDPDSWFVARVPAKHAPLAAEPAVRARCTLPDGRAFVADFAAATPDVLDASPHERTTLRWAVFRAADEPRSILGAHLFTTTRADGLVEYAVEISNGSFTPGDARSFCGGVYYSDLRLELADRTRKLAADLRAGEQLVDAGRTLIIATGGGHYFPVRAHFARRAVSYPRSGLLESSREPHARAALELSDVVLPRRVNAWGALKISRGAMPNTFALEQRARQLVTILALGAADAGVGRELPPMGPFAPLGNPAADMVSGTGIVPVAAPEFSRAAIRWHRLAGDLVGERMPIAAFHAVTGAPLTPRDWSLGGPSQGFEYRLTRSFEPIDQIPLFYAHPDFNTGTCDYRPLLASIRAHDDAHLCRGTKDDQASWLFSHDWLAWLRQRMVAADVITSHTLRGARPFVQEYPGQYLPYSLEASRMRTLASPGHGFSIQRSLGWAEDAVVGAANTLPLGRERAELVEWTRAMFETVTKAALPSGLTYDGYPPSSDNGMPWAPLDMGGGALPMNCGAAPQFQIPIANTGLSECALLLGIDDPAVRAALAATVVRAGEQQYLGSLAFVASAYGGTAVGPPWYLVTSENGVPVQKLKRGGGLAHWIHCWHDLALSYRASGDRRFLDAMLRVGPPVADLATRLRTWRAQTVDREWIVLPQSVLEEAVVVR